jgi:hypothetical protein
MIKADNAVAGTTGFRGRIEATANKVIGGKARFFSVF